jgi:hypothetical protein
MSVSNHLGFKIVLPRQGADEFWQLIHEHFAEEDEIRWKYLAMLALRENAGWPLDAIGQVFGHCKGHVTRCISNVKRELRTRFEVSPELLELDEGWDAPEVLAENELSLKTSVAVDTGFSNVCVANCCQADHKCNNQRQAEIELITSRERSPAA